MKNKIEKEKPLNKSDETNGNCICILFLENVAINRWLNLLESLLQFSSVYFDVSFAIKKTQILRHTA